VKIADLLDSSNEWRMAALAEELGAAEVAKYAKRYRQALSFLTSIEDAEELDRLFPEDEKHGNRA
jgi:hypothetical protein